MRWKIEHSPHLAGYTVEWAAPGNYYLSKRNRVFHSEDLRAPLRDICRIDAPLWQRAASTFRLGQRLLRFMVYNIVPLPNGDLFVTFGKTVGIIRNGRYFELPGLLRPCRVLRGGCAVASNGDLYFGEYLANTDRGPIHIYRYPANGARLETAHTFPEGSIRHIHGLYLDKYTDSIYCMTGDAKSECRVIKSSDGFASSEILGEGDETWRAVSVLFDADNIYYGTDAEYEANQIFSVDRKTLRRERLGEVSGTVFYSKLIGTDLFFTTTAENAPSQKENVAGIWTIGRDGTVRNIAEFEKDLWHGGLFMFGTIHFPFENRFDDRLYFSLVGVKGDGETFCLHRI